MAICASPTEAHWQILRPYFTRFSGRSPFPSQPPIGATNPRYLCVLVVEPGTCNEANGVAGWPLMLLLPMVQAGYALEALARGAMDLSRRFSLPELEERWRALLTDPGLALDASRRMLAACGQAAVLGELVSRRGRGALLMAGTTPTPASYQEYKLWSGWMAANCFSYGTSSASPN